MALETGPYRLEASLPNTIFSLHAIVPFLKLGVSVATRYPTLMNRVEPNLSDDSDRDNILHVSENEYAPLSVYNQLSKETGFNPGFETGTPVMRVQNKADYLIQPKHRLFVKNYTLVAVEAPDGHKLPSLRNFILERVYGLSWVYVLLPGLCPRFPLKNVLGTLPEKDPSGYQSMNVMPPELAEVLDAIAWCKRLITTSYWAMHAAVAYKVPVEFISFNGSFVNPYNASYWREMQDLGYNGYDSVEIKTVDFPE